jgi:hypothetical protein
MNYDSQTEQVTMGRVIIVIRQDCLKRGLANNQTHPFIVITMFYIPIFVHPSIFSHCRETCTHFADDKLLDDSDAQKTE